MVTANLKIVNEQGMHARPSASFAKIAGKHKSTVRVTKGGDTVNGRSILGLMMLGAGCGTDLQVTAEGPDAQETVDDLKMLVESGFEKES